MTTKQGIAQGTTPLSRINCCVSGLQTYTNLQIMEAYNSTFKKTFARIHVAAAINA
jgi:hypothetical protein